MVFESRVLESFGPKRKEVELRWRRLHCEELHNFYASTNIIRVIMSRRMTLAWHVARVGCLQNFYRRTWR